MLKAIKHHVCEQSQWNLQNNKMLHQLLSQRKDTIDTKQPTTPTTTML